jgi:hypothetical protein
MSITSTAPYSLHQVPPSEEKSGGASLWKNRLVTHNFGGLTSLETARLASRLLALTMVGCGIAAVYLSGIGIIASPFALLAIPCAIIIGGVIIYNIRLNDYENPDELLKFQRDAAKMNFESVFQAYGWNDVLRFGILDPEQFAQKYREQVQGMNLLEVIAYYEKTLHRISQCSFHKFRYSVPSPRESADLWSKETEKKTFENIIATYPLDKLQKYSIVEKNELNCIYNLKKDYEVLKLDRDAKVLHFQKEFDANTLAFKRAYDAECTRAHDVYAQSDAVKELQGCELHYAKERQAVQQQLNSSKVEARARFEAEVASFTQQGSISYSSLSNENKARHDQSKFKLQQAENQADTVARLRIEQINAARNERLIHLNREKDRLALERNQTLEAAKKRYDEGVVTHLQRKQEGTRPFEESFQSSVADLNGRYQAYLRTVNAQR